MLGHAQIDSESYEHIRRLVHQKSGIALKGNKATLVAARLATRMRELGLANHRDYLRLLASDETGRELTLLLDAIATNVTYFFRESDHFDFVRQVVDGWQKAGQRRFRFWSAACSTGEEPYSLAMSLADLLAHDVDLRILATDISTRALAKALAGAYSETAIESVPPHLKTSHLQQRSGGHDSCYVVQPALKEKILFRRLNLVELPTPLAGPLDIIFCRNVMIYFDQPFRQRLVAEFHRLLRPGGYLIVSHSESLVDLETPFQMVKPSVHKKADAA